MWRQYHVGTRGFIAPSAATPVNCAQHRARTTEADPETYDAFSFAFVDRNKSDTVATINVSQHGRRPARCRKIGAEATQQARRRSLRTAGVDPIRSPAARVADRRLSSAERSVNLHHGSRSIYGNGNAHLPVPHLPQARSLQRCRHGAFQEDAASTPTCITPRRLTSPAQQGGVPIAHPSP